MEKIKAILLGAGGRGMYSYAEYALRNPEKIEFIAVAEPNAERRERFVKLHNIAPENAVDSWEKLLERPKMAEAAFICTQDQMHFEPAMMAFEKGYHVLLEKPMSTSAKECLAMGEYAEKHNRIFSICHVLRYTDFYTTIKGLLDGGRIGKLITVDQIENVGFWHFAHSYVRGMWRNKEQSGPVILTKCCHDMDILLWLAGDDCVSLSSYGSLSHFKKENAPKNAPLRCLDGCPLSDECQYYAPKTYMVTDKRFYPFQFMLCTDQSPTARMEALKTSQYGRCVYHCDNNVADHQVVNMQFKNGVTAAFTVSAFTEECTRTLKMMGTTGEIIGDMEKNEIIINDFTNGHKDVITLKEAVSGHSGGDDGIMKDFINLVKADGNIKSLTNAKTSVQSHLMSFAAEESRLQGKTINLYDYKRTL